MEIFIKVVFLQESVRVMELALSTITFIMESG
jgi:hypothetical protein